MKLTCKCLLRFRGDKAQIVWGGGFLLLPPGKEQADSPDLRATSDLVFGPNIAVLLASPFVLYLYFLTSNVD